MRRQSAPLAAIAALGGCGGDGVSDDLDELRESANVPLYYVGDSFEGLPLTHVDKWTGRALFVYGDCEAKSDMGCSPPLQIQNWPLPERHPASFQSTPTKSAPCRRFTIRGVPAANFGTSGGALEVYTGPTVVVVYGEPEQARRVAGALRSLDDQRAQRLPPPAAGVVTALVHCKQAG